MDSLAIHKRLQFIRHSIVQAIRPGRSLWRSLCGETVLSVPLAETALPAITLIRRMCLL